MSSTSAVTDFTLVGPGTAATDLPLRRTQTPPAPLGRAARFFAANCGRRSERDTNGPRVTQLCLSWARPWMAWWVTSRRRHASVPVSRLAWNSSPTQRSSSLTSPNLAHLRRGAANAMPALKRVRVCRLRGAMAAPGALTCLCGALAGMIGGGHGSQRHVHHPPTLRRAELYVMSVAVASHPRLLFSHPLWHHLCAWCRNIEGIEKPSHKKPRRLGAECAWLVAVPRSPCAEAAVRDALTMPQLPHVYRRGRVSLSPRLWTTPSSVLHMCVYE